VETYTPLPPDAHTGLSSCASLNTAVALKIGANRVTYQPNLEGKPDPNGLQLRIDGKLVDLSAGAIALPAGGRIVSTSAAGGIQIEYPGGTTVIVTPAWWAYYQVWYLNVDVRHARANAGIMGTIAPQNWLPALPDGGLLGPLPASLHDRYVYLYGKFADAWRVTDSSSLFDYAPGTSTGTFTLASWPEESPKSCRLPKSEVTPLKPIEQATAEKYCSVLSSKTRWLNCVQDVMVTGEPSFVDAYLTTEKVALEAQAAEKQLLK